MQFQKDQLCMRYLPKLKNKIEGPSLNTQSVPDKDALKRILANIEDHEKIYEEKSLFPLGELSVFGPLFRSVELPSSMWTSSIDYVLCFKLHFWPDCASHWFNEKHDWISDTVLRNIKESGYHLVAKPIRPKTDLQPANEWRISFSIAEKVLSGELTSFQKKCYLVAKTIFYKNFKSLTDDKTGRHLPSYTLKTVKFRLQDSVNMNKWQQYQTGDNLLEVVSRYYQELANSLRSGNLPCYFIKEMNILHGFSEAFLKKCAEAAERISSDPTNFVECWDLQQVIKLKEILSKINLHPDQARNNGAEELFYYDFNLWLDNIREIHCNLLMEPDSHIWL